MYRLPSILVLLICLVHVSETHAQSAHAPMSDSVKRTRGRDVLVEEKREVSLVPAVTVVSRPTVTLEAFASSSRLSDITRLVSSSLAVRSYGSMGGIALVSFRGLPAEYTTVFRDGVKITQEQNSLTDLGRITSATVERIDLLSGGSSLAMGGDAIGASLNLISPSRADNLFRFRSEVSSSDRLHSVTDQTYTISIAQQVEPVSLHIGASRQRSTGAFLFRDTRSNLVTRTNNDASVDDIAANVQYSTGDLRLQLLGQYVEADRGAPGEMVVPGVGASHPHARQQDRDLLLMISSDVPVKGDWFIHPALAYQSQYETYDDPQYAIGDRYLNRMYFAQVRTSRDLSDVFSVHGLLSVQQSELASNQNEINSQDTLIDRTRAAAFAAVEMGWKDVTIVTGLRLEQVSDIASVSVQPQANLEWRIQHADIVARVAYGRNEHAPTFNQLYWKQYGNPELSSEKGATTEITLEHTWSVETTRGSTRLTAFQTTAQDQIVWLRQADNLFRPVNVQHARSRGVEFAASAHHGLSEDADLSAELQVTWLDAVNRTNGPSYDKLLPYAAQIQTFATLSVAHRSFGALNVSSQFRSARFTDLSEGAVGRLPAITLLTIGFYAPPFMVSERSLRFHIGVNNLMDVHYQEVRGFPLPGRVLRGGLELTL